MVPKLFSATASCHHFRPNWRYRKPSALCSWSPHSRNGALHNANQKRLDRVGLGRASLRLSKRRSRLREHPPHPSTSGICGCLLGFDGKPLLYARDKSVNITTEEKDVDQYGQNHGNYATSPAICELPCLYTHPFLLQYDLTSLH
jgi:hypothetical protein